MNIYLIRGLPGVGKTTLANRLVGFENVFEADHFFIGVILGTNQVGYRFDPSKIKDAHQACQCGVEDRISAYQGVDIAVSNTFTQRWEMEPYYRLRENYDVRIIEITVSVKLSDEELAARCVHGVPVEKITQMRARWEL